MGGWFVVAAVGSTVVTPNRRAQAQPAPAAGATATTPQREGAIDPSNPDRASPHADTHATPSPVHCETSPRVFLELALGFGGMSRVGDIPPIRAPSWGWQLGQRLDHGLYLVEDIRFLESGYISPFRTDASETHQSVGAGIRWTPFEPRPQRMSNMLEPGDFRDLQAFYIAAVVGIDGQSRVVHASPTESTEDGAESPMASLAVGWLSLQGRGWTVGPELREQLAYYDGRVQRGWQLSFVVDVTSW